MYVGKTFQRLEERTPQHVPKFIKNEINLKKISLDVNVNPLKTHLFWIWLLVNICKITKFARKTLILTDSLF